MRMKKAPRFPGMVRSAPHIIPSLTRRNRTWLLYRSHRPLARPRRCYPPPPPPPAAPPALAPHPLPPHGVHLLVRGLPAPRVSRRLCQPGGAVCVSRCSSPRATSWPAWARACSTGLQALLKVNIRLATTDYLSNGYDGLQPSVTLPVLLSSTVISLSACEVICSITFCFFRCNRTWRPMVISSPSPLPKIFR